MDEREPVHERYVGVDRSVLDEDVWAEKPAKTDCPKCGMSVDTGSIRCPRCNALLIMACGGSCASCGSKSCVRPQRR
jgi:hypothetical protein